MFVNDKKPYTGLYFMNNPLLENYFLNNKTKDMTDKEHICIIANKKDTKG